MLRDTVWGRAMCLALGLCGCTAPVADTTPPWTATGSLPPGTPGAAGNAAPGSVGGVGPGGQSPSGPNGLPAANGGPPGSCDSLRLGARAVMVAPRQYVNVLRDLLGPMAVSDADLTANSEFSFDTIDRPIVTTSTLDRFQRLAEKATETLRGHTAQFLGCSTTMDATCVRTSLQKLARRSFKRTPTADEMTALMALRDQGIAVTATDQGETGTLLAIQAMLFAPSTLYRTEFTGPVTGATRALSPHERAAAIGALLLDSTPDEALLAAADDGSLATDAGVATQVDRLLALPRVRQEVTATVLSAYNIPRVFTTPKDATLFPQYTSELQNSMFEETRRFVEDVLWTRKAPISELLTSKRTFIDANLAKLYGLPAPKNAFDPVDLPPERSGLLTQASLLTVLARTDKTSVVARGLFMRGSVLCLPKIPGPPASVQAQVTAQLSGMQSQKELAAYRAMTSPCMGCHSQFDRFGLMLESFDPIGRRTTAPVDPVDFTGLDPLSGVVSDVSQFSAKLAQTHSFETCLADRTLGFALTAPTDSQKQCLMSVRDPAKLATTTMRDLLVAVASSAAFNVRTSEP